ncbi:MAG: HIT domain-containing protein [Candidatus Marinimicrobia bacterium]|jgi:ATP adenylyltransferase|nr:HIT domain-containing protein [Candidatus Neomarinimicrobiota bacterium]MBT7901016.1 HIT domain-containing protein [Candidatus Neomarinimicrobiota bacterium]
MIFKELYDFIDNKMRMSHIYQPLLIKTLVEADGSATVRQLAQQFVLEDESQLQYYENTIKKMPVKVLKNHGIVIEHDSIISLNVKKITFKEKAQLKRICEEKIQQYLEKRGLATWDYRFIDNPVPDSIRYKILKEGKQRCALCGITAKERMLDVDHIIPRSRGGKSIADNLQVLCAKCNRSKGNKDDTDFRDIELNDKDQNCPFCNGVRKVADNHTVFAMKDNFPVTKDHHLIIPYRHTYNYFTMTENERSDATELIRVLKNRLEQRDPTITGFNIGMNSGESAGQTVMHSHIHLIPRRKGDTPKPRGGVRGVIPKKMDY